jgi:hypothetical protein
MDESKIGKPKITQAMIDAYDEYTHLTLDRRRFMERLTALAGTGAAAAAIAPLLAANSASAEVVTESDERLLAKNVLYGGATGQMRGYIVRPKEASEPLGSSSSSTRTVASMPISAMSRGAWPSKASSRSRPTS